MSFIKNWQIDECNSQSRSSIEFNKLESSQEPLYAIAKVKIPQDALIIRSKTCIAQICDRKQYIVSNKLRTNKMFISKIYDIKTGETFGDYCKFYSLFDNKFEYTKGKLHEPHDFMTHTDVDCVPGLYFFLEEDDALKFKL